MKDDFCIEEVQARSRFQSESGDTILIGDNIYSKYDLERIVRQQEQQYHQPPTLPSQSQTKLGNPIPLGLCAFALTCFVLSLMNCQAHSVTNPNLITSLALFYGGAAQFLAGMWAFAYGDTFGGVAFGSFGPFWLSFAAINMNAFGIQDSYKDTPEELATAVGFFLFGWFIFTFIMVLCTLRTTFFVFIMYGLLDVTFLLLACGNMCGSVALAKAGGYTGLVTAFLAWYNAYGMIRSEDNTCLPFFDIKMPF